MLHQHVAFKKNMYLKPKASSYYLMRGKYLYNLFYIYLHSFFLSLVDNHFIKDKFC
jgi:hypothetical protein